jgi:hypothetical protein
MMMPRAFPPYASSPTREQEVDVLTEQVNLMKQSIAAAQERIEQLVNVKED